jgi:predicted MFS family arabinose efflux permease
MMHSLRNYALVTAAYWGFTLTDGALRMLVLLHFHTLGYTPLQIAFLFLFYEFFGVVTNLLGGWLGSRTGLRFTLHAGLALQVFALGMLALLQPDWTVALSVAYVMAAQALSGIAKDLTKMSAKSAIKYVVAENRQGTLFKWVAILTGSKNALKGAGFFLGGVLLAWAGFSMALYIMAGALLLVLTFSLSLLPADMGRSKARVKFRTIFSRNSNINYLSTARFFLFGARDVWFVVGLPLFLSGTLGWSHPQVGAYLALWVIGYGIVQSLVPALVRRTHIPHGGTALHWVAILALTPLLIIIALNAGMAPGASITIGLAVFGIVFAINSAIHSYLILSYTDHEHASVDVGFYYMANAAGRLCGTVLSGYLYQIGGLNGCLWASLLFIVMATLLSRRLPARTAGTATT